MNHAGIASGCDSCHAAGRSFFGVAIVTPPATHVPVGTAACEGCHAAGTFTTFSNTPMNHAPVAGVPCANCHETGKTFFGATMVTRPTPAQDPQHPRTGECGSCHTSTSSFNAGVTTMPSNHIPTSQPCSLCHTQAGNFAVATMNHQGITAGCATCHATGLSFANVTPVSPPPTHIPTTQSCELCHSPTKFTNFAGGAMNHTGISSGCTNCHASGKSFFGVAIVTPPATHIPIGAAACEGCHSATTFTNFKGTAMNHTPVAGMTCATCHTTGMSWYGATIVTLPTTGHIPNPTSLDCKGCHTSTTSFTQHTMNHTGITSNCTQCHGGQYPDVRSKPKDHPPTNADCSQCHNTTSFDKRASASTKPAAARAGATKPVHATTSASTPATANLAATTGTARSVPGASPTSPTSTSGASPGLRASTHNRVMPGTCASCHNGATAPARPAKHLATQLSCDACHRTTAWVPANFNHTGVPPAGCVSCHNGSGATGKAGNHFLTMRSCDTCHRVTSWQPTLPYRHVSPAYPVNHPNVAACASCHVAKSELITWRYPNLKPACAGCHGPTFRGGPQPPQPQTPSRSGQAHRVQQ